MAKSNSKILISEEGENKSVPFAVVEAYKTIRSNLLFLLSQNDNKAITISSSLKGEGKSTTSVNIAIALSQLNSKVMLIDCDLRKATIHKKLKIKNSVGITSVLANFCDLEEAITKINPYLSVLTSGPIPPNAAELLSSKKMDELLARLNQEYDYIIIDTPPVNVVSDALVVAAKTNGIVMVVKDNYIDRTDFEKALSSIEFAGVRVLGVVLNGAADIRSKSYRYKYVYKYSNDYY